MPDSPLQPEDLTTRSPSARPAPTGTAAQAQDLAVQSARLLHDFDCDDVLVFDVRGVSPITQFIVIASGTSDRQIKALGGRVSDLAKEQGFERYGEDTDKTTRWVVLDYVDVMVHLFEPTTRGQYDLEMLWGDAPQVAWRRQER
jgi:ribosome-associated protein